jgi:Short C-terminal domain
MIRRVGRPGLLGTAARTAVIAGTAKATTSAMDRRSQQRAADQQAQTEQQAVQAQPPAAPPPSPAPPPAPVQPAGGDDLLAKLTQLGELRQQGLLTDEEFTAAKAKLLQ